MKSLRQFINAFRLTSLLALVLLLPTNLLGQSYEDIKASSPEAKETVLTANAFIFDSASANAQPLGRFVKGTEVLAYAPQGFYYMVATKEKGFVGYVLVNKLDVPQDPNQVVISPITNANFKDPGRARILSLAVPGAGQFYANREQKGVMIMAGSLVSFVGGYALTLQNTERVCQNEELQTDCSNVSDKTGLLVGSLVAASIWAYGIFTAKGDANKFNTANGLANRTQLYPTLGSDGFGLALKYTW